MFRIICLIALTCFYTISQAQSYMGFGADNFNGVHGVLFNPANIADSRTKVDINLVSASAFTTNSYVESNYWEYFTKEGARFSNLSTKRDLKNEAYGFSNADILGPSVLVSLSPKHSVALTTRFRSLVNLNNVSNGVINHFDIGLSRNEDLREFDINSSIVINNWFEVGATYARVLKNDKVRFLKAGATIKYILGAGGGNALVEDGTVIYIPPAGGPDANTTVFLSGRGEYNYNSNFDKDNNGFPFESGNDVDFNVDARGLGLDLGFVYEYRPNHRSNVSRNNPKDQVIVRHISTYKYKIGVSIMDLGAISYKTNRKSLTFNPINRDLLLNGTQGDIEPVFGVVESQENTRLFLPARIRAEFDYKIADKFYANAMTQLSLVSKKSSVTNHYANQISVSPRFETKWLTIFSPITVTSYGGVQWGGGFRLGPIFLGSGSLFSRILDSETREFDIFAGIKIPIFHSPPPPPEEVDPTNFKSGCNGCIQKEIKQPTKRLNGFSK